MTQNILHEIQATPPSPIYKMFIGAKRYFFPSLSLHFLRNFRLQSHFIVTNKFEHELYMVCQCISSAYSSISFWWFLCHCRRFDFFFFFISIERIWSFIIYIHAYKFWKVYCFFWFDIFRYIQSSKILKILTWYWFWVIIFFQSSSPNPSFIIMIDKYQIKFQFLYYVYIWMTLNSSTIWLLPWCGTTAK